MDSSKDHVRFSVNACIACVLLRWPIPSQSGIVWEKVLRYLSFTTKNKNDSSLKRVEDYDDDVDQTNKKWKFMVGDVTHYTLSSLHTRTKSIFLNFNQDFVCFLAMFDDHFRECAQHIKNAPNSMRFSNTNYKPKQMAMRTYTKILRELFAKFE